MAGEKIKQAAGSASGHGISRRKFLKYSGIVVIAVGSGGLAVSEGNASVASSTGYMLVDTRKCQGCTTCMLACSLVHEGASCLSLARIQVVQNPFEKYPDDISLSQCRQCVTPSCVANCPTGALHADSQNGNVRRVDKDKCTGCKICLQACSYRPARTIWDAAAGYAQKCDLCVDSVFWDQKGGPEGKQACVESCPMDAIRFTSQIPDQNGTSGYNVNLRSTSWEILGYPTD